jgi:type IV secretory pathway TrbL component
MRSIPLALLALSIAVPATAQHDADRTVAGGGQLAPGWLARTDGGAPFDNIKFEEKGSGWDISVGPAVTLYRASDMAQKGHGHGTGLIFGGTDLQSAEQVYSYFLVRGDGSYIIKTRTGDGTAEVAGWTKHAAINESELANMSNEVAVRVAGNDVIFLVNGAEVNRAPKSDMYTDGIVGIRLNHNLDMHIDNFEIRQ